MNKWNAEWWRNGRVVVKPWAMMEEEFGLNGSGSISCQYCWSKVMEETCPESRIIEVVDGKWNGSWISKAMLLGPAFEWGEEIEVRDFEDSPWIVNKFFAYTRCLISPFTVHGQYFILMMGFFLMLLRVIFLLPVTTAIHLVTGRLWCGTSIIRNG